MKALCEEMGLNTLATPQKYLAEVLIPSAVNNSATSYTSSEISLNTQTTFSFPPIKSLVHISQLHKFHKVIIEQPLVEFDG